MEAREGVLERNRYALKEWASVCDGLARGGHILILRKGGLLERRGGFELEHREFFLFPTRFHAEGTRPGEGVSLELYATAEDDVTVTDLALLRKLDGLHGVPWEDLEKRFHYGRENGVHAIALRVYRLAPPHAIPNAAAYDGCKSWVELEAELPVNHEGPVLNRTEFRKKLEAVHGALHG